MWKKREKSVKKGVEKAVKNRGGKKVVGKKVVVKKGFGKSGVEKGCGKRRRWKKKEVEKEGDGKRRAWKKNGREKREGEKGGKKG